MHAVSGDRLARSGNVPDELLAVVRKDVSLMAAALLELTPAARRERLESAGDDPSRVIPAIEHLNTREFDDWRVNNTGLLHCSFVAEHPRDGEGTVNTPGRSTGAWICSNAYHELREYLIQATVPVDDRVTTRRGGLYRNTFTFYPSSRNIDEVLGEAGASGNSARPATRVISPKSARRTTFTPTRSPSSTPSAATAASPSSRSPAGP